MASLGRAVCSILESVVVSLVRAIIIYSRIQSTTTTLQDKESSTDAISHQDAAHQDSWASLLSSERISQRQNGADPSLPKTRLVHPFTSTLLERCPTVYVNDPAADMGSNPVAATSTASSPVQSGIWLTVMWQDVTHSHPISPCKASKCSQPHSAGLSLSATPVRFFLKSSSSWEVVNWCCTGNAFIIKGSTMSKVKRRRSWAVHVRSCCRHCLRSRRQPWICGAFKCRAFAKQSARCSRTKAWFSKGGSARFKSSCWPEFVTTWFSSNQA